jgi:hypothetical protein
MLSAFVVVASTTARAASAALAPTNGTEGQPFAGESPEANAIRSEPSTNAWTLKLDSTLRDAAAKGSKELQDILIYTADAGELAPLLDKYAVQEFPEALRGQSVADVTRTTAVADGIVSTRVTVPTSAIAEIAGLPGVLGIERAREPQTAEFTNVDLTEARERF